MEVGFESTKRDSNNYVQLKNKRQESIMLTPIWTNQQTLPYAIFGAKKSETVTHVVSDPKFAQEGVQEATR